MVATLCGGRRVGFVLVALLLLVNAGCKGLAVSGERSATADPRLEKAEQIGFSGWMKALTFKGEGSLVIGGCHAPSSNGSDGSRAEACERGLLQVWSLGRDRAGTTLELPAAVTALAVSPDGSMWIAGDAGGRLISSRAGARAPSKSYHQKGEITALAFMPDGRWVASGSLDRSFPLGFLDLETGGVIKVKARFDPVSALAVSPDGKHLAVGMTTGELVSWAFSEGSTPTPLVAKRPNDAVTSAAFSPDGRLLAYGRQDGHVEILEWSTGRPLGEFKGSSSVKALAFTPDGRYLAYGQENGKVLLQESKGGRQVWSKRHLLPITDLAFSPDGSRLAVATYRTVDVYRVDVSSVKPVGHEVGAEGKALKPSPR